MQRIGVVGAGTMGSGIGQLFAQKGYQVIIRDIKQEYLDRALEQIEKNLAREVKKGRLSPEAREKALKNLTLTTELKALAEAELVIEAVSEDLELKKEVFQQLDAICSRETILATNTSALSITEIAAVTQRPDKVLGVHFFNPVPVMNLVELIKGVATSQEIFQQVEAIIKHLGKEPIAVNESPGFIVNRLLIPMLNEAIFMLQEGVAKARDIDQAMKLGANHPLGPLALADFIGLDVCLAIMETLYQEFADAKYRPCPLLRKMVRAGQLGRKTGQGFYQY